MGLTEAGRSAMDAQVVAPFFLPAHVYVCAVQEQVFFFDLKRNRHLSAPLHELRGIDRFVRGWPPGLTAQDNPTDPSGTEVDSRAAAADLSRHHLLSSKRSRDGRIGARSTCPVAQRALPGRGATEYPDVCWRHLLSFLKAAIIARYRFSVCSLYSTVRRIQRLRARRWAISESVDLPALQHLITVFRRLQPVLCPTPAPCLLHSIALLEFLAAQGYFPRLVLGVQARPFGWQSWLQHDDVVLNANLEDVLTFTPVMVA
jgi:Transglutaminase-like superfamily